jgi:prolyl-tRNA synthetase
MTVQSKILYILTQVVIVPIWKKGDEKAGVLEAVDSVQKILKEAGIRVKVDDSETRTPGWKFNFYEMKVICFCWKPNYLHY